MHKKLYQIKTLEQWTCKKTILSSLAVVFMTIVFVACSQPVTELPSSTGRLGVLAPSSSVIFDTTDGWYSVDGGPRIAEGRFRNNNVTPGSQGARIRLFDFTNINLDTAVRFEAVGRYPLGLLATGDIIIECDLPLAGQAGTDGNDGFGIFGGSGGGGGGAVVLASNSGSITLNGTLDVRGGQDGQQGTGQLPGSDSGGLAVAGGEGGGGGTSPTNQGIGGTKGNKGATVVVTGWPFTITLTPDDGENGDDARIRTAGDGGDGGDGIGVIGTDPDGGDGGRGGDAHGTRNGDPGIAGNVGIASSGGAGKGAGGGGDTANPGSTGGAGGAAGAGAGGSSTGGGTGGPGTSGGGGSFIIAAPNGITGNGSILLGSGVGAIYGDYSLSGTVSVPVVNETGNPLDVNSVNEVHVYPYSAWQSLPPAEIGLSGGSGEGGGGGDGQGVPAEEKEEDGISLEER